MSCVSKKPFPKRFTSKGVKRSIFVGSDKYPGIILPEN